MVKSEFRQYISDSLSDVKRAYGLSWVYVRIRYVSKSDYYMAMTGSFPIPFIVLYIDYSARKLGKDAVTGLMAHEFAHYFTSDERQADQKALEAGFKTNLIAFHKAHNKRFEAFEEHEGMTLAEIDSWVPR